MIDDKCDGQADAIKTWNVGDGMNTTVEKIDLGGDLTLYIYREVYEEDWYALQSPKKSIAIKREQAEILRSELNRLYRERLHNILHGGIE